MKQLRFVVNEIYKSENKDAIQLVENYYLDSNLQFLLLKFKLRVPPFSGIVLVFLSAGLIRNYYVRQYTLLILILCVIVAGSSFVMIYIAITRHKACRFILDFSREVIKLLENG